MMMDISVQNRQNLVTFSIWICSLFSGYRCKKDFKLFKTQVKLLTRKYCCSVRIRDVEILYPVQYLKKNYLQKWNKSKFLSPSATTSAPVELTIKHALTISEKQRKCLQSLSLSQKVVDQFQWHFQGGDLKKERSRKHFEITRRQRWRDSRNNTTPTVTATVFTERLADTHTHTLFSQSVTRIPRSAPPPLKSN